jgi:hypothetical protein
VKVECCMNYDCSNGHGEFSLQRFSSNKLKDYPDTKDTKYNNNEIRKYSKANEQTFEQNKPNIPCTQRFTEVFIAPAFCLLLFCIFYDLYCCCCAQVVLCSKVFTLLTWIFLLCVFHVSYKWMCKMLIRFIIKHDHFNVFFYMKINGQCGYKICLLYSNILNILYTILIKCTLFLI